MWRVFWIGAGIVGSIAALLVWVASNATFLFNHPRTAGYRVEIDNRTGGAVVIGPLNAAGGVAAGGVAAAVVPGPTSAAASPRRQPKAVVRETDYDFGVMDPLTMGRHDFVVRNQGDAPLKLTVGPTTCKCTLSGLSRNEVPPGETATVTLEWNTGRDPQYSHAGTIQTNDPANKWLEFRVRGSVRTLVALDDPEIVVERVEPDEETIVERLVFSQVWSELSIRSLETSLSGLQWHVDAVDPASVPSLNAKAVARLRITLPADLNHGEVTNTLRLVLAGPESGERTQHLDIPLRARVLRRIGFYGKAINEEGIIDLGTVPEGKGAKVQVLVKVRDPQCDLAAAALEVSPPFLKARLEPQGAQAQGLYTLTVELDHDAPVCAYRAGTLGRLQIDTPSQRVGSVDLKVSFVVIGRQPL